jgi:hypothetical protein
MECDARPPLAFSWIRDDRTLTEIFFLRLFPAFIFPDSGLFPATI